MYANVCVDVCCRKTIGKCLLWNSRRGIIVCLIQMYCTTEYVYLWCHILLMQDAIIQDFPSMQQRLSLVFIWSHYGDLIIFPQTKNSVVLYDSTSSAFPV